jgi:hypothetical protein
VHALSAVVLPRRRIDLLALIADPPVDPPIDWDRAHRGWAADDKHSLAAKLVLGDDGRELSMHELVQANLQPVDVKGRPNDRQVIGDS